MKLTQRERNLLLVLITVLVLLGGFILGVVPLSNENEILETDTEILKLESVQMKAAINKLSEVESQYEQSKEQISNELNLISDPLTNSSFDFKLSEIAREYKITINSLQYGMAQLAAPSVNYGEEESIHYELKNEINLINEKNDEDLVSQISEYQIIKKDIILQFKGTYADTKLFIDRLQSGFKTMYIGELSTNLSDDSSVLRLELYSIDKIKELGINEQPSSHDNLK